MEEITVPINGKNITVEYTIEMDGDEELLTVILPNGEPRSTHLRGLSIKTAVTTHLRAFFSSTKQ